MVLHLIPNTGLQKTGKRLSTRSYALRSYALRSYTAGPTLTYSLAHFAQSEIVHHSRKQIQGRFTSGHTASMIIMNHAVSNSGRMAKVSRGLCLVREGHSSITTPKFQGV